MYDNNSGVSFSAAEWYLMMMINISRELCGTNGRWWMGTKFGDGTPRCTRPLSGQLFPRWQPRFKQSHFTAKQGTEVWSR